MWSSQSLWMYKYPNLRPAHSGMHDRDIYGESRMSRAFYTYTHTVTNNDLGWLGSPKQKLLNVVWDPSQTKPNFVSNSNDLNILNCGFKTDKGKR